MANNNWEHATHLISNAIDSGEFKPGKKLPSMITMSQRWDITVYAALTACNHLTASGVLRHGTYGPYCVADEPEDATEPATREKDPIFITVAEAAVQARTSHMTIYRLVHEKVIRCTRIGRGIRIYADSWEEYLKTSDH